MPHEGSEAVSHTSTHCSTWGLSAGLTDGELLEEFACQRGEAAEVAFAQLVERHGPMVCACLGIIGKDHDAQDAFQATFLILWQRPHALGKRLARAMAPSGRHPCGDSRQAYCKSATGHRAASGRERREPHSF